MVNFLRFLFSYHCCVVVTVILLLLGSISKNRGEVRWGLGQACSPSCHSPAGLLPLQMLPSVSEDSQRSGQQEQDTQLWQTTMVLHLDRSEGSPKQEGCI